MSGRGEERGRRRGKGVIVEVGGGGGVRGRDENLFVTLTSVNLESQTWRFCRIQYTQSNESGHDGFWEGSLYCWTQRHSSRENLRQNTVSILSSTLLAIPRQSRNEDLKHLSTFCGQEVECKHGTPLQQLRLRRHQQQKTQLPPSSPGRIRGTNGGPVPHSSW